MLQDVLVVKSYEIDTNVTHGKNKLLSSIKMVLQGRIEVPTSSLPKTSADVKVTPMMRKVLKTLTPNMCVRCRNLCKFERRICVLLACMRASFCQDPGGLCHDSVEKEPI